jgi:hypothetical protein
VVDHHAKRLAIKKELKQKGTAPIFVFYKCLFEFYNAAVVMRPTFAVMH